MTIFALAFAFASLPAGSDSRLLLHLPDSWKILPISDTRISFANPEGTAAMTLEIYHDAYERHDRSSTSTHEQYRAISGARYTMPLPPGVTDERESSTYILKGSSSKLNRGRPVGLLEYRWPQASQHHLAAMFIDGADGIILRFGTNGGAGGMAEADRLFELNKPLFLEILHGISEQEPPAQTWWLGVIPAGIVAVLVLFGWLYRLKGEPEQTQSTILTPEIVSAP